jgi:hypothetical protein
MIRPMQKARFIIIHVDVDSDADGEGELVVGMAV